MFEISVIVPVYNVENLLRRCLTSLVGQTFDKFEIIIIIDGSTDGSSLIVEEFKNKYPSIIRVKDQSNRGQSESRNIGTQMSSSKYIYYIDSDDYIESDTLRTMYITAEEHQLDYVVDGFKTVTESGDFIARYPVEVSNKGTIIYPQTDKDLFLIHNAVWNRLYLRSVIVENGIKFYRGYWYEDLLFSRQYSLHSKKAMVISENYYNYVQRDGSLMTNIASENNYDIVVMFNELIDYYKKQDKYVHFSEEIEFLAIEHMYISASIRLIRGSNYELLEKINSDFIAMFPNYKNNKHLDRLPLKNKLILKLLDLRLHNSIKFIYSIYRGD